MFRAAVGTLRSTGKGENHYIPAKGQPLVYPLMWTGKTETVFQPTTIATKRRGGEPNNEAENK